MRVPGAGGRCDRQPSRTASPVVPPSRAAPISRLRARPLRAGVRSRGAAHRSVRRPRASARRRRAPDAARCLRRGASRRRRRGAARRSPPAAGCRARAAARADARGCATRSHWSRSARSRCGPAPARRWRHGRAAMSQPRPRRARCARRRRRRGVRRYAAAADEAIAAAAVRRRSPPAWRPSAWPSRGRAAAGWRSRIASTVAARASASAIWVR